MVCKVLILIVHLYLIVYLYDSDSMYSVQALFTGGTSIFIYTYDEFYCSHFTYTVRTLVHVLHNPGFTILISTVFSKNQVLHYREFTTSFRMGITFNHSDKILYERCL